MDEILYSTLDSTELKARYDAACRRLLSNKSILAWILKYCTEEFAGQDVDTIAEQYIEGTPQIGELPVFPDSSMAPQISGMSAEEYSLREGKVSFDIRFHALAPANGELIKLIINVEAQNDFHPGYSLLKRSIYYASRMISAQHGTEFVNGEYQKIKKVYSIWVCMDPPEAWKNTITRYRIREENCVGSAHEPEENYDLLSIVLVCLNGGSGSEESELIDLLDTVLSNEVSAGEKKRKLSDEYGMRINQQLEREVLNMCNLSEGVERRGIEKGMAQGMEKGMAQGMEKGSALAKLEILRRMVQSGMNYELAAQFVGLSPEERGKYEALLAQ